MFTGIIESLGKIVGRTEELGNVHFDVESNISDELKIDQSVAHDGVCLTVVKLDGKVHRVTAIKESLNVTNLKSWELGHVVNLERCMPANGRFDGHIVQGHVDTVGQCTKVKFDEGSWRYYFSHSEKDGYMTVAKGSITINGISLTVVDSSADTFSVAVIPYTHEHTNFKTLKSGSVVNLEFDIVGKYVAEMLARQAAK